MKPLSCSYFVTATVSLQSDDSAARCEFLCDYYSRTVVLFYWKARGHQSRLDKVRMSDTATPDCYIPNSTYDPT